MKSVTANIRRMAEDLYRMSDRIYWENKLRDRYGLNIEWAPKVHDTLWITRQIVNILEPLSPKLVRFCNINKLVIRDDMGESKTHTPNHGYFAPGKELIALNDDIFYHPDQPDDFFDQQGYFISRPAQTLIHEIGHAADYVLDDISLKPAWMALSGWSKEPKSGLKQLIIQEKGVPDVRGEYYFDPKITEKTDHGFTRFYGKRNPYDDFADCFGYFYGGLKSKVPEVKRKFLDKLFERFN